MKRFSPHPVYVLINYNLCSLYACVVCSYYNDDDIAVCYTDCDGDEDELTDCYIRTSFCDTCGDDGVVSITCSKGLVEYYTL